MVREKEVPRRRGHNDYKEGGEVEELRDEVEHRNSDL